MRRSQSRAKRSQFVFDAIFRIFMDLLETYVRLMMRLTEKTVVTSLQRPKRRKALESMDTTSTLCKLSLYNFMRNIHEHEKQVYKFWSRTVTLRH